MREQIIFTPLVGIEWPKGKILLGEDEFELHKVPVNYETYRNSYYYTSRDLRVDVDENRRIEFIEYRGSRNGFMCPVLCDIFVFENEVSGVLKQLAKHGTIEERENGHMYVLKELSAALWRERTEADVEGFIADMKADGIAVEGNADVEEERKMAKYFQAVSIGKKGYFTE